MLYTYVRFPLLFSREQYLHRGNRSFSLSCVLRVSLYKSILDLALFLYSASFPGVLEIPGYVEQKKSRVPHNEIKSTNSLSSSQFF